MCTIQFQGVCFFRRGDDQVDVYLPVSDGDTHVDGTRANEHFPRLFVELVPGVTASGDFSIREHSDTIDGTYHYRKGISIDLSRVVGKGECQVTVSNQKDGLDDDDLGGVLSFKEFSGNGPYPIDRSKVAAWLRAVGGVFKVKKTKPKAGKWKVSKKLLNTTGDAEFDELAWNVIWKPGKKKDSHEIVVSAGAEVVATVTIPGRVDPDIIIGNLDNENPATWPLRPLQPMKRCEGEDGRSPSTNGDCYDNDFKWLYGLLKGSYSGSGYAPVPRAQIPASAGPGLSVPRAYDTPTCFPGGD